MPITITSATIRDLAVDFAGGVATNFLINYTYTDSNGVTSNGQYRKSLTLAQQTSIDNFINNLIAQVSTDLNLTVTIAQ